MRKRTICLGVLLLGLLAVHAELTAANWDRFRGPNGTGIADDKNIPTQFSATKNVRWKAEIPGVGHSSPVIWGDRLFLESSSTDNKERSLICLNTADGKAVWSKTVPGSRSKTHAKNTLASSTPATDGERVYAAFWNGEKQFLYAYDFQGNLLWNRDLGGWTGQHGPGNSPIVYKDKVIFVNEQDGAAAVLAFDAKTGNPAWQKARPPFRTCYSTPFLLEKSAGTPELIVASTAGITSYDPLNGTEHWSWTWKFDGMALRTVSSPVAAGGLVLATSGDGSGLRHTVAVKTGGKGDVTQTNLAWQNKKNFPYVPSLLVRGPYVYFINDKGIAACHSLKNGSAVWSERVTDDGVTASPVLINGKIYIFTEKGNAIILDAQPKFRVVAKNSMGDRVMASPAVANNRLYVRTRINLFCIGK